MLDRVDGEVNVEVGPVEVLGVGSLEFADRPDRCLVGAFLLAREEEKKKKKKKKKKNRNRPTWIETRVETRLARPE
jgi:hypothetical protein